MKSGLLEQRAGDRGGSKRVHRPAGEHAADARALPEGAQQVAMVSAWAAALINVAIRAHASAAATAKTAARCTGEPRLPSTASSASVPAA